MWKNNITTTYRNLIKNRSTTLINIVGMGIGLASCWMILLYISEEFSYDMHQVHGDRIYRIATSTPEGKWAGTPAPIARAMQDEFPEVENAARLLKFPQLEKMLLKYEKGGIAEQFYETKGYYADSTFFDVFAYDLVYGNSGALLQKPSTLVLSETLSRKMFGEENPVDKVITIGMPSGEFDYTIKGVFRDNGFKSHIDANFFLSMQNQDLGNFVEGFQSWATNNIFYTYVKLAEGADAAGFAGKLPEFFDRNGRKEMEAFGVSKTLFMQPLQDIYLKSDLGYELSTNGNISTLYIFGSVAGFILLIACINFMNLSTARSGKRGKEVGIRKVLGAQKATLVRQFLVESSVISMLGLLLAFVLAHWFLPFFNSFTGKGLMLLDNGEAILWMVLLAVLAGLLAGTYPAFYLSSFRPINILKGKLFRNVSGASFRRGLVIFQFSVAACLIVMVVVIGKQMQFVQHKDLGFTKDQQLVIPLNSQSALERFDVLKEELLKKPQIKSVSIGSTYPGIETLESLPFYAEGKSIEEVTHINFSKVGDDYVEALGFNLLDGRSFTKDFDGEHTTMVLNESAVRQLGYPLDNAVGRLIFYELWGERHTIEIVGVVRDFNFESLHKEIKPFGLLKAIVGGYLIARVEPAGMATILKDTEDTWQKVNPGEPFGFSFLDQDFQRNYEKEAQTSNMIIFFSLIAVFIACLGLYGLASFMAEQRTKEIGIRKTLGASEVSIVKLLSGDFGKTVLISMVIAMPVAYYFANNWLENFAYKIDLEWWYFVGAGLLTMLIALLTVGFQSVKAAWMNPVSSLRSE